MNFLQHCLQPDAVTMLFIAVICLAGYGYPGYKANNGLIWLLWLVIGILALVAWVLLVIA